MIYPWHATVQEQLYSAKQAGRLPHAILFAAESGCGHDAFVGTLVKSLLCLTPDEKGIACGHCRSCEVFSANSHPDFINVKTPADKQIIGVDQVRALNHFLELSRSYSPVRVALIGTADDMNINAANSLLKTLEEPTDNTHIVLVSYHPEALLPTIRSRCQQIRLSLPPRSEALAWLNTQTLKQPAEALLALAAGRPLNALQLDDGELLDKQQFWLQQLSDLLQGRAAIAPLAAEWAKEDKRALLDWQISLVQEIIRNNFSGADVENGSNKHELSALLVNRNTDFWRLNDGLIQLKSLATHPLNAQLFAENMLSLWK